MIKSLLRQRIGVIVCLFCMAPMLFHSKLVWGSKDCPTRSDSDNNEMMLFDFTKLPSVDDWVVESDAISLSRMPKPALTFLHTHIHQRAIFFMLLHPETNGVGFAGVYTPTALNLQNFSKLEMKVRGQGSNSDYKVVLRHKGLNEDPHPTYEQVFQAPEEIFKVVRLSLSDFKPYYKGQELNGSEAIPLDVSNITSFGLEMYGGQYLPLKQEGVLYLDLNWIKVTNNLDGTKDDDDDDGVDSYARNGYSKKNCNKNCNDDTNTDDDDKNKLYLTVDYKFECI